MKLIEKKKEREKFNLSILKLSKKKPFFNEYILKFLDACNYSIEAIKESYDYNNGMFITEMNVYDYFSGIQCNNQKDLRNNYTYDVINDNWIKTEIRKDIVLPGSGRNPKENLECKKEEVDISLFNVPEGKII